MLQRKTRGGVDHISYSPSGRLLLGRDAANNVQVWDARNLEPGERIAAGDPREKLLDCFFRPGGLRFLQAHGYVSAEQDLPAGPPRPEHEALPGVMTRAEDQGWGWSATWRTRDRQHFA